jgi:hypothetical protein
MFSGVGGRTVAESQAPLMKAEVLELRGGQRLLPVPIEVHIGPRETARLREHVLTSRAVLQFELS